MKIGLLFGLEHRGTSSAVQLRMRRDIMLGVKACDHVRLHEGLDGRLTNLMFETVALHLLQRSVGKRSTVYENSVVKESRSTITIDIPEEILTRPSVVLESAGCAEHWHKVLSRYKGGTSWCNGGPSSVMRSS